jgi:hypothetical protein
MTPLELRIEIAVVSAWTSNPTYHICASYPAIVEMGMDDYQSLTRIAGVVF